MKKVAIVLCVLMLVGTSLPLVQADPEPTNNPIVTVHGGWGVKITINGIDSEVPIIMDTKGVLPIFHNRGDYVVIEGVFMPTFYVDLWIGNDYYYKIVGKGFLFFTWDVHIKE